MDKLECPRCKNEGLKGTENYCPICGLALKNNKENLEKRMMFFWLKNILKKPL